MLHRLSRYRLIFACAIPAHYLAAQTAASLLSGRVTSQAGNPVRAIVSIQPAGPLGFPTGGPLRILALADGTFTLRGLRAGKYSVCAQIPASEVQRNSYLLDTCEWASAATPLQLSAGQGTAGLTVVAPPGALLQVQVLDPEHLLPPVTAVKGPPLLEPQLQLTIRGSDRIVHHLHFASQNSAGRSYQTVVPVSTALGLTVQSSVANAFDQTGALVSGAIPTQAVAGAGLPLLTFTLHSPGN